ncbi:MAG: TlyA family RNA methyltransferase [Candidatus Sumerlaeia bacterium]|nr:TlyA family RNA methyltransferase [Candidatus Sumerlaeia bacterium]
MPKIRLDTLLHQRGLAESREKAQRLIRAGVVHTTDKRLEKPGLLVDDALPLFVKGTDCPYVSRGGLKLAGALVAFQLNPEGIVALDLGASTGGFTDCLLQRGAEKVYAIDVGRGQLHHNLQLNPRVVSREQTHLDSLEPEQFKPAPGAVVADLSFISLSRAYPVIQRLLEPGGWAVLLVKPQFEVGRDQVPQGGVIRDTALQQQVLERLNQEAVEKGFELRGTCESPITGGDGNREFFQYLVKPSA